MFPDLDLLPSGLNLQAWFKNTPMAVGASGAQEIVAWGGMRLLKIESPLERKLRQPLLIIPSLINRSYILDLLPGKSLIEHFRQEGIQVYLLDWGAPVDEDQFLTFSALVKNRLNHFCEKVLELEKVESLHLVGHCLGGTLACLMAARKPQQVQSLSLYTTPLDFSHAGQLGTWAQFDKLDVGALTQAYGHAPWALLQSSFQLLKPLLPLKKVFKFWERHQDPQFRRNFFAMELWSLDNVSFVGPCYQFLIEELYRKNSLVQKRLDIEGESLSLGQITCPVLNVYAVDDHIVLPDSTMKREWLSDPELLTNLALSGGHIGALLL